MTLAARMKGRIASALPGNLGVRLDDAPICSFTFDDCPRSALDNAGASLQAAGVAGTFFVSGGFAAGDETGEYMWGDDLLAAAANGHEIGCHTYGHPHLRSLSRREIEQDLDENLRALRAVSGSLTPVSFAYPFGEVSIAAKAVVAERFAVGRGVRAGLNGRVLDLAELRANGITSKHFDPDRLSRLIRRAAQRRSWLVFLTHDVTERPGDFGCTPQQFDFVLGAVRAASIEILPLRAAIGRIAHRTPRD
jgi:peptidoglycan/xylan/chitin deacetylase (PgdA/CDA1 family)